jgi:transposase
MLWDTHIVRHENTRFRLRVAAAARVGSPGNSRRQDAGPSGRGFGRPSCVRSQMVECLPEIWSPRNRRQAASRSAVQVDVAATRPSAQLAAQESQIVWVLDRTLDRAAARPSHRTQVRSSVPFALPQRVVDRSRNHTAKTPETCQRTERRSHPRLGTHAVAVPSKRARRLGAHLVFIDESGALLSPLVRRTLAPKGETPILEHPTKNREKVSLIAALTLSPQGRHLGFYFSTLVNDHFESFTVAWFVRELLRHLRGPVIVVWDRGNMHKGPEIRQLLADFPRLSLEFLPPYAPELNPVEQIWTHVKWNRLSNFAPHDSTELEQRLFEELHECRHDQDRLRSFWHASELPIPRAMAS